MLAFPWASQAQAHFPDEGLGLALEDLTSSPDRREVTSTDAQASAATGRKQACSHCRQRKRKCDVSLEYPFSQNYHLG